MVFEATLHFRKVASNCLASLIKRHILTEGKRSETLLRE